MLMNKRQILSLTIALITAISLLLGACQESETKVEKTAPEPSKKTIERSENSFGARYNFTLGQISREIAPDAEKIGIELNNGDWEVLSDGLVDDNGVKYTSYCNKKGKVTFTAAVENESGKVMNIGCGCDTKQLSNAAYRSSFIRLSALIAIHAGGYNSDDLSFFMIFFKTLIEGLDETFYYQGSLYFKSVDKITTVLMVAPCDDKYTSINSYKEYTEPVIDAEK